MIRVPAQLAAVCLAIAAPALAQQSADAERLNAIARDAARRFSEARAAEQTRPTAPAPPPGTVVDLALDEATARALERNLDIAVERLAPQTFDLSLASLQASFRPTLNSTIGRRSQVNLPTTQLNGGQRVINDTTTYNAGLSQALPWGGGSFLLQWNNNRQETSNIFANFNPSYTSNFVAAFNQPLLRGFLVDSTRQQLRVTAINRDISEIQLRGTIAATLASVRNGYWDLVYAVQAVDVARRSLELAEKLIEDNKVRVEVGTMAPIDVIQAEAEAATRRQALAQAEATWRTAELALKRLIVNGTEDPLWRASLNPVDRPAFTAERLDVEGAVRTALERRTDLDQARRQIDSSDVTLQFLGNQRLPALDLSATYGMQGLGGTQFLRQGSGLGSSIIGTIPGGYSNALRALTNRDFPTWNVALNISYPIGASAADAQFARARVQRNQAVAQLRALELQVATDVTSAALQVESSLKRYEAASAARELAQKRLDAEHSKFEVGMSTNFFVVQAQRDLADAQNSELRALLDYRKALVDFQRVQEAPASRGAGAVNVNTGGTTGGRGTGGAGAQGIGGTPDGTRNQGGGPVGGAS